MMASVTAAEDPNSPRRSCKKCESLLDDAGSRRAVQLEEKRYVMKVEAASTSAARNETSPAWITSITCVLRNSGC